MHTHITHTTHTYTHTHAYMHNTHMCVCVCVVRVCLCVCVRECLRTEEMHRWQAQGGSQTHSHAATNCAYCMRLSHGYLCVGGRRWGNFKKERSYKQKQQFTTQAAIHCCTDTLPYQSEYTIDMSLILW